MKKIYPVVFLIFSTMFMTLSATVFAHEVKVSGGYIRETIPGTVISSAYMRIKNSANEGMLLVGASSNVSPRIEIHEHVMNDGMMRMQQRPSLIIDAESEVILKPSGYHLMMFELTQPLKDGELVWLTLHFADHDDHQIQIPVKSIKKMQHHH